MSSNHDDPASLTLYFMRLSDCRFALFMKSQPRNSTTVDTTRHNAAVHRPLSSSHYCRAIFLLGASCGHTRRTDSTVRRAFYWSALTGMSDAPPYRNRLAIALILAQNSQGNHAGTAAIHVA